MAVPAAPMAPALNSWDTKKVLITLCMIQVKLNYLYVVMITVKAATLE